MARGKPGLTRWMQQCGSLQMNNCYYTTDAGTDAPPTMVILRASCPVCGCVRCQAQCSWATALSPAAMYNISTSAMCSSFPGLPAPGLQVEKRKFLCPVPGFMTATLPPITEEYGFELISVPMTNGPIWTLWRIEWPDDTIKGIWCVPSINRMACTAVRTIDRM